MSNWNYNMNDGLRCLLIEDCPGGDRAEMLGFEIREVFGHEVMSDEDYEAYEYNHEAWLVAWNPPLPEGAIPLWRGVSHDEDEMPYAYYALPVTDFGHELAALAEKHFGGNHGREDG